MNTLFTAFPEAILIDLYWTKNELDTTKFKVDVNHTRFQIVFFLLLSMILCNILKSI